MKRNKLKRAYLREWDLSEKAFESYSQLSFVFYQDSNGAYYVADCPQSEPVHIGDINDLENYLLSYLDE